MSECDDPVGEWILWKNFGNEKGRFRELQGKIKVISLKSDLGIKAVQTGSKGNMTGSVG